MSGRSPTHAGAWTPWVPSAVPGGRATLGTSSSSCAESVSKAKLSPKRSQLCRAKDRCERVGRQSTKTTPVAPGRSRRAHARFVCVKVSSRALCGARAPRATA